MLDDQQRVAQIAQALQISNQAVGVARVQADRRLIEHVERAHQMRSERRGELDALRFAARKRGGEPVERQVVEPHFVEESQPLLNFFQHFVGDRGFCRRSAAALLKNGRASFTVIWQTSVIDRPAIFTARASARSRVPRQSGQSRVAAIAAQKYAHVQLVFLAFEPAEKSLHAGKIRLAIAFDDGVRAARR